MCFCLQAQSFGPKACILMRVVETVGPPTEADEAPDTPLTPLVPPAPATGLNAPTFTLPMALAPVAVAVPVPLSQVQTPPSQTPAMTQMGRHRPAGPPRPHSPAPPTSSAAGVPPRNTYRGENITSLYCHAPLSVGSL